MANQKRAQRFVVIPQGGLSDSKSSSRARWAGLSNRRPVLRGASPKVLAPLRVVNTSPPDGAVLVSASGLTIEDIKARVPEGTKVFEEQWYRLERRPLPW